MILQQTLTIVILDKIIFKSIILILKLVKITFSVNNIILMVKSHVDFK